jgi:hypothetical protein
MSTYHIEPDSDLALEAVEQVKIFHPDTYICIRGYDEDAKECLGRIAAAPDQSDMSNYVWLFVKAGEWMAEFKRHHTSESDKNRAQQLAMDQIQQWLVTHKVPNDLAQLKCGNVKSIWIMSISTSRLVQLFNFIQVNNIPVILDGFDGAADVRISYKD